MTFMRWWGDDPGQISEQAKGALLFVLDVMMYSGFVFLGFRLLEVHTEIFTGGVGNKLSGLLLQFTTVGQG